MMTMNVAVSPHISNVWLNGSDSSNESKLTHTEPLLNTHTQHSSTLTHNTHTQHSHTTLTHNTHIIGMP